MDFEQEVEQNIKNIGADPDFLAMSRMWLREGIPYNYAYNFKWLRKYR